ncbi:MAG: hypothetical protein WBP72_09975 [Rhodocyclaceae bacterium]
MTVMSADGYQPATVALERAELRRLFNCAHENWLWAPPAENPAVALVMPKVNDERKRVLSSKEWRVANACQPVAAAYLAT